MAYFRIFLILLTFLSFLVQAAEPGEAGPVEDDSVKRNGIDFMTMPKEEQDAPLTFCRNLQILYHAIGGHCLHSINHQVNIFNGHLENESPLVTEAILQKKITEASRSLAASMIKAQKFSNDQIIKFITKQKAILDFIREDFSPERQESSRLNKIFSQALSDKRLLRNMEDITEAQLERIGLESDFLIDTRTLYQSFVKKLAQHQCLLISDLWTVVQFFYGTQDVYVGGNQMRIYPQLLNLLNDFSEEAVPRDKVTQVSIPFHKEFYRDYKEYTLDQYSLLEKTSTSQPTLKEALYLEKNYTCHSVFELPPENSPFSREQLFQFKKDVQKDNCVFSPREFPSSKESPSLKELNNYKDNHTRLSALFYNKDLPIQNAIHWLSQGHFSIPQDPKDFKYLTTENLRSIMIVCELAKNAGSINDGLQLLFTIQKNVEESKKSFLKSMEEPFNEINDFERKFQTLLAQIKETQSDKEPVETLRKELEKLNIQLKNFDSNLKRPPLSEQERKWKETINDFFQQIEKLKKNDPESFTPERMKKLETQKKEAAEVKEKRLSIDKKKQSAKEQLKRVEDEFKKLEASYLHKAQEVADRNAAELLAELAEEARSKQSKKPKHKAKRKAEAEAKHQAEEESRQAAEAEADASRKARDTKRKGKAKAKRKAEAEAKRQEEEKARQAAEAETRHQAEAKRKAEEETKRKAAKAEADGKSKADAEKRLAEEEALLANRIQQALLEKKREAEEAAAQKEKKKKSAASQRRALTTQEPRFRSHGRVGPVTPAEADHTHQRQGERLRVEYNENTQASLENLKKEIPHLKDAETVDEIESRIQQVIELAKKDDNLDLINEIENDVLKKLKDQKVLLLNKRVSEEEKSKSSRPNQELSGQLMKLLNRSGPSSEVVQERDEEGEIHNDGHSPLTKEDSYQEDRQQTVEQHPSAQSSRAPVAISPEEITKKIASEDPAAEERAKKKAEEAIAKAKEEQKLATKPLGFNIEAAEFQARIHGSQGMYPSQFVVASQQQAAMHAQRLREQQRLQQQMMEQQRLEQQKAIDLQEQLAAAKRKRDLLILEEEIKELEKILEQTKRAEMTPYMGPQPRFAAEAPHYFTAHGTTYSGHPLMMPAPQPASRGMIPYMGPQPGFAAAAMPYSAAHGLPYGGQAPAFFLPASTVAAQGFPPYTTHPRGPYH